MTASITFAVLQLEQLLPAVRVHFAAPGTVVPEFSTSSDRPKTAGVYVWCTGEDRAVLYIGSAAQLSRRLEDEARWVDEHQPDSGWAPSVIHFLQQRRATPFWLPTTDLADARLLERRLIEWHRTTVGCAPLLTGWAPKPGSDQHEAVDWARHIWNTDAVLHRSWDPASHTPSVPA